MAFALLRMARREAPSARSRAAILTSNASRNRLASGSRSTARDRSPDGPGAGGPALGARDGGLEVGRDVHAHVDRVGVGEPWQLPVEAGSRRAERHVQPPRPRAGRERAGLLLAPQLDEQP